ncbi:MAG TPA: DUF2723 domain-containing protein [Haliangiales bacterium]|nr:DUF2723 domain-containing protein [Haliangiales bacterium]
MGPIVFAAALAAYTVTAAPAVGWLDSAEFVAAAQTLGISHPPGQPLAALLGRAVAYLPIGDIAFRVNLASAIAGAAAAAMLYRLVARLRGPVVGAAAALAFAFAAAAWEQSIRAEVYALTAALLLFALDEALRGRALAAALATGLALTVHPYIGLAFAVPAAAYVLAGRPGVAAGGRLAAAGLLGLCAFLYLPLRAGTAVDWGDPNRVDRFWWTVSARAFQKSLGQPEPLAVRAGDVATALTRGLTLVGAGLALVGAYVLVRRRETRAAGLLLVGVAAAGAAGRALVGFDFDNPDALGYLLPALAALVALAAAAVPRALAPLAFALAFWHLAHPVSLRGAYAAEGYGRAVLDPLPPRTLLLTSFNETTFILWSLAGERPDVTIVDRNFLTHPFAADVVKRRHPELAALLDAPLRGGAPTPVAALPARPIAFELAMDFAPDDPAVARLAPHGPVAHYGALPDEAADARAAADLLRLLDTPAPIDRHGAARALAWNAYLTARFYCMVGRRDAARAADARARSLADRDDAMLAELERACGLGP